MPICRAKNFENTTKTRNSVWNSGWKLIEFRKVCANAALSLRWVMLVCNEFWPKSTASNTPGLTSDHFLSCKRIGRCKATPSQNQHTGPFPDLQHAPKLFNQVEGHKVFPCLNFTVFCKRSHSKSKSHIEGYSISWHWHSITACHSEEYILSWSHCFVTTRSSLNLWPVWFVAEILRFSLLPSVRFRHSR